GLQNGGRPGCGARARSRGGNALKHRSTNAARFALNGVALAAACLWGTQAWALGLGRLTVQSALGETLRAEIEVTSLTPEEAASLQLRVAPPDAYRAAGVEYNPVLPSAHGAGGAAARRPHRAARDQRPRRARALRRRHRRGHLGLGPAGARIHAAVRPARLARWRRRPRRRRTVSRRRRRPPPARRRPRPAARPRAPAQLPARRRRQRCGRRPPPPRPRRASGPAACAALGRAAAGCRRSAAAATARHRGHRARAAPATRSAASPRARSAPGISLDQMLVSLFRANPQAFMGDNMNRLKAGAVLSVPAAEEAAQRGRRSEAREIIVAQSNDFAAYRQRLASGGTAQAATAPARQAGGQVQAQVDDRRQAAAATPDRLTLSQGAVQASAPGSAQRARPPPTRTRARGWPSWRATSRS
ncbi:MAG: hypothetical protein MZW92_24480, partial [Comamonadaceae bacterium]|nr:hypothetical protein [Comamonadaceae bacterium]